MNERIREILSQCQLESIDGPEYPLWTDLEKFAELIVRECVDTIKSNQWAKDNQSWSKGMQYSAELIKEHFGVEQ